jgi:hypothetical protein
MTLDKRMLKPVSLHYDEINILISGYSYMTAIFGVLYFRH